MKVKLQIHKNIIDWLPDFVRLNEEWLRKYFRIESSDAKTLANPGKIIEDGGLILFGTVDGEVVATCALLARTENMMELAKMGVTDGWQGRGLGRQLADAAIAEARRLGKTRLYLETNDGLAAAMALYERLGFRHLYRSLDSDERYDRANVFMMLDL